MSLPTPPPLGHPVPNTRHAVSVQMPTWKDMCGMALGEARVKDVQQAGYPRSFIHKDIKEVVNACIERFASPAEACLLFPAAAPAAACKAFLASCRHGERALAPERIALRAIDLDADDAHTPGGERAPALRLHAVFFPAEGAQLAMAAWRLGGMGISSRLAEQCLARLRTGRLRAAPAADGPPPAPGPAPGAAHATLRTRIAALLERAPAGPPRHAHVAAGDVYLYPTGMAAIYHAHQLLLGWRGAPSVVFGFPYELTLKMIETYGPPCTFFGFGTDEELAQLEAHVEAEAGAGRKVQAVWCECPSNPLLRTANLDRVRRLADQYEFVIILDETIGSFANVDVLGVADIVVTSLTKSFSGFSDVMGGSIVLNPSSPFYTELKASLDASYRNDLYEGDAIQLEINSRDFLPRAARMSATAAYLVDFLHPLVADPCSTITAVYYPKVCWSADNYRARMRPPTEEFTAGYGGLFTVQAESVEAASAFFDALNVHKGPSLGANLTLAQPYVQTVFYREKAWAAQHGLQETIVRISVGLEDQEALLEAFKVAVRKSDETKRCLDGVEDTT